jgi:3-oxoacyl-[acyl-carrier protein] reductase
MASVIVTGAGRGIGRGIALRLAGDGWDVLAVDIDEAGLSETVSRAADNDVIHTVRADVTDPGAVDSMLDAALSEFGEVGALVNNAAVSLSESFLDTGLVNWQHTLDVNLTGSFICAQAVARWMVEARRPGRIINLASTNSYAAERRAAAYVASKGGVLALTRAMAVDLAPHGILVNGIAPGPIRTDENAASFEHPDLARGIQHGVPLARAGTVEDIAGAVAFLLGADASFIVGATLVVDGGYLAYARFD